MRASPWTQLRAAMRAAIWLGLMVGLVGSVSAQEPPAFDDSTSVIEVEIPVNVHVGGEPLRGLTRESFRVLDGRRERPIVGFEVVDLGVSDVIGSQRPRGERSAKTPVPIGARRHFLLLFDLSYTRRDSSRRSVEGAREWVDSGLHPADLVAVGFYSRSKGAGLLLGFTPDRRQVSAVLDQLAQVVDGKVKETGSDKAEQRDPLRLVAGNMGSLMAEIGVGDPAAEMAAGLGGRGGGFLAETLGDMTRANSARSRDRARSELKGLTDALAQVADATARLEGRKLLVYFSEGFDDSLLYEEDTQRRSLLDQKAGARATRYVQDMADRFRRAGWTIQTIDPGGARMDRGLASGAGLSLMAQETGGESYTQFGDLAVAMDSMLGKTSVTYLLAIQADDVKRDGGYHKLDIKLVDGPRGATLLHRPGYYAPKPESEESEALEDTFQAAQMLLSGSTSGTLETSVLLAPFSPPVEQPVQAPRSDKAHVAAWVEISGEGLLEEHSLPSMEVEVYAYVLDGEGEVRDFFTRDLRLDLDKVEGRLRSHGLRVYGELDLPVGSYDLRLLVRNPATGRHSLGNFPVEIPALDAELPRLLPPFFLDDEGEALVVIEAAEAEEDRYPFIAGDDERFIPDVTPRITEDLPRARICLMGYHLVQGDMLLDAGLIAADGSALSKERLALVGRSETGTDGLDRLYFGLDAVDLAPGEYGMEVTLHDLGRGQIYSTFMPFQVAE